MLKFTQRIGKSPIRFEPQIDSLDEQTRVDIWNYIHHIIDLIKSGDDYTWAEINDSMTHIWCRTFGRTRDSFSLQRCSDDIKQFILNEDSNFALEILEDFTRAFEFEHRISIADTLQNTANKVLKRNLVGYNFVAGYLAPITEPEEIEAVNSAATSEQLARSSRDHLQRAIALLSDRDKPNYSKSIAESIDAVEAEVYTLTGETMLSQGLKKLKDSLDEGHPALADAWGKLYGWAGDAGVRHARLKDEVHSQELATYVLVTSSAFLNFLRAKRH